MGTNGGKQVANVTIQPIRGSSALNGMVLCVFTDVAAAQSRITGKVGGNRARLLELEQELELARRKPEHPRRDANLPGGTQIHQ